MEEPQELLKSKSGQVEVRRLHRSLGRCSCSSVAVEDRVTDYSRVVAWGMVTGSRVEEDTWVVAWVVASVAAWVVASVAVPAAYPIPHQPLRTLRPQALSE